MTFSDKEIYSKGSRLNFREKKLVSELKQALNTKKEKDKNFSFNPASDFKELKALHETYCISDASFEETETENIEEAHRKFRDSAIETQKEEENESAVEPDEPFTEANPEIRDYVLDNEYNPKFDFKEPKNEQDAFSLDDEAMPSQSQGSQGQTQKQDTQKKERENNNNNNNDGGISAKTQKRSTKFSANYMVEGASNIIRQAFIFLVTRNISEVKLAEYEMSGEYELDKEVTIDGNIRVTIKQFLEMQREYAVANSSLTEQEKSDLKEVVGEFMKEKNIEPTPTQNLLIVGGSILGRLAIAGIQVSQACNSVLEEIRTKEPKKQEKYRPPAHEEETIRASQEANERANEREPDSSVDSEEMTLDEQDIMTETGIATKE